MKTKLVGSFEVHFTKEACGKERGDETRVAHVAFRGKNAVVMDMDEFDRGKGLFHLDPISFDELLARLESGDGAIQYSDMPLGNDDMEWVNIWVVLSNKKGQSIIQDGADLLDKLRRVVRKNG